VPSLYILQEKLCHPELTDICQPLPKEDKNLGTSHGHKVAGTCAHLKSKVLRALWYLRGQGCQKDNGQAQGKIIRQDSKH
jgi:hypothetical protein